MKRAILFFILIAVSMVSVAMERSDSLWNVGVECYAGEDYEGALRNFKALEEAGYVSPRLYYNIGNTYYKMSGYIAYSILYYERALKLDPSYKDAQSNLEFVHQFTLDKIETVPEFVLVTWFKSFRSILSSNGWAYVSLASFVIMVLLLLVFRFGRSMVLRKISFAFAIIIATFILLSILFSFGLKGEMDFVMNRKDIAPKNLAFGLVTLRYNFVPGKAKKMKKHYDSRLASMDANVADALRRADAEKARADQAEAARQRLAQENADLQRQLNDCQQSKTNVVVEKPEHTVLFDNNSSYFTKEQAEALKAFAEQYKGKKLSLVAEASKSGSKEYNQRLSERRLERVIKALQEVGFAEEDLKPSIAIGSQRGIDAAEARRVTITVE